MVLGRLNHRAMTTAARGSSKAKRAKLRKKATVSNARSAKASKASKTRKQTRRAKRAGPRVVDRAASRRAKKAVERRTPARTGRNDEASRAQTASDQVRGTRVDAEQLKFGFSDERSELAVLQKQNRRLLLRIAKRRALITVSKQAVEELMRELSERVVPYRDELFDITREVCDLRERLLESSGLPASQLERVRWALNQMVARLPVEEAESDDHERTTEGPGDDQHEPAPPAESKHASERAASERPAERSETAQSASPENETAEFLPRGGAPARETYQREAATATKPTGDQSGALRSLFKKLAIAYHPDRVRDETAKAARTKIMKDLTGAFESGDLARLVELERTLAVKSAAPDEPRETPERHVQRLAQANLELTRQLKELKDQLKRIKEDCPFTLDLRLRDPARLGRDELDQMVLERHMEVERAAKIREFIAMFAAGRMKVSDFLKGPTHLRRMNEARLAP